MPRHCRRFLRRLACALVLLLPFAAARAVQAQPDAGFVYALQQVNGGVNQVHGFSVNTTTGVLTPVAGSPFAAGTGAGINASEHLAYDSVNGRLFVLNVVSNSVSVFNVNTTTGALTAASFSPIPLPVSPSWRSLAVSAEGSLLAVANGGAVATFALTSTAAVAAPGSPAVVSGAEVYSSTFSRDGAYLYAGGNAGTTIAGFAVNQANGALTPLAGSPFLSGGNNPAGYASDVSGRVFVSLASAGSLQVFTTPGGALTPGLGPVASGLTLGLEGVLHPGGAYMVVDRTGNQVGVYGITGTGSTTVLSAVPGSPFPSGGTFADALALNGNGSLLFVAHGTSRNIQTSRVNADFSLTPLALQAPDSTGATGTVTGIAFVPRGAPVAGFVYALQQVDSGTNRIHGFSVEPVTGALTRVFGSPFAAGTGGFLAGSEQLVYDRVNGRVFAVNAGSGSVSAFAVQPLTGALTALPFSPIALPSFGIWNNLAISPDGAVLAVADVSLSRVATFLVTDTAATAAPGSPVACEQPWSSTFSRDGAYLYVGGNSGTAISGFAVSSSNGALTALAGSPFPAGTNPSGYATDGAGRLFTTLNGTAQLRVFTSSAGVLTPASGGPTASGLAFPVQGTLIPGAYVVVDRNGNQVGVYAVSGTGSGTTLTPVAGSPFPSGGLSARASAYGESTGLLFVANGDSRNIQTSRVNGNLSLTPLTLQPADTLGTTGSVTGIAFAPVGGVTNQYRLFLGSTGEHLYTTDFLEYTVLGTLGWQQEGIAYQIFKAAGTYGGVHTVPLHRLYHSPSVQHFWTTDGVEVKALSASPGWSYEGIPGFLLPTPVEGATALYRLAYPNPLLHLWTTDFVEYSYLQTQGWLPEGILGYPMK